MIARRLTSSALAAASALAIGATAAVPLASGAAQAASTTVSATLTQCVTSVTQAERSATFAGAMSAVPGTAKMAMRVELEERLPHEHVFRTVPAPAGASAWRTSEPHVKIFKYLDQVTDLSAPARYRATVRFRWLNGHGGTVHRATRRTGVCTQPASPALAAAPIVAAG